MTRARTSKTSKGRLGRGRKPKAQALVPVPKITRWKPMKTDHWCSPCQMIRPGDERECMFCVAKPHISVSREMIEAAKRRARGSGLAAGNGARDMGRYDLAGKPWGYKPFRGVPGFGPGKKGAK